MPEEHLSRLLGLDKQILTTTLTTLLESGVASLDELTGALMNRRMVRDEKLRQIRAEAGKLGGNPALLKQKSTTRVNHCFNLTGKQTLTPSSSSSFSSKKKTSSSKRQKKFETGPPDNFQISDEMREWANAQGFDNPTIERQTAAMLDWHRARGECRADWNAAWRNWMRKAHEQKLSNRNNFSESAADRKNRRTRENAESLLADLATREAGRGLLGGDVEADADGLSGALVEVQ